MSRFRNDGAGRGAKASAVWAKAAAIAILALAAGCSRPEGLAGVNQGTLAKLEIAKTPAPPPSTQIQGPDGRTLTLADLKGQVLVVNLWASWCAPCAQEMPTLAKLQAAYQGKPVKVVAISLDKGDVDIAKAKARISDNSPLQFYHAPLDLSFALSPAVEGLPTTIFYDSSGRERARLTGPADWTKPEAHALVDRLLSLKG
jgi:thiol-disulfide isomerase/thioredoxin